MSFTLKVSKNFKDLLKNGPIRAVRKEFSRKGPIKVKQAIVQDMIKGVSPVKGGGKWKKYSPSYRKAIRKASSAQIRSASPAKGITPVNLRLTGGLHKSLKVFTSGGFFRSFSLVIKFESFLADIHNRRGAGKAKAIRRLLPTKSGEQFNKRITDVMIGELKKAVSVVAKKFSGQ